jgi:ketosteroid isomerase-like protein
MGGCHSRGRCRHRHVELRSGRCVLRRRLASPAPDCRAGEKTNWDQAFKIFRAPVGYEIRDLTITVSEDVAFAHSLNLLRSAKDGSHRSPWVRFTACLKKVNGNWLIVHDQVSVPIESHSGKALPDLEP